jgi:ribosomal protein S18 acetylase RimI-like enzyme
MPAAVVSPLPRGFCLRKADLTDAPKIALFNRQHFPWQSSPLWDSGEIKELMGRRLHYRLITTAADNIVSAGAAWIDPMKRNAEMCNFATAPRHRQRGFGRVLLTAVEDDLRRSGADAVFCFARSGVPAANELLYASGYTWSGTMVDHSLIGSQFEDLHVWCARLQGDSR